MRQLMFLLKQKEQMSFDYNAISSVNLSSDVFLASQTSQGLRQLWFY